MTVETTIKAGTSKVKFSSATWTYNIDKGTLTINLTTVVGYTVDDSFPVTKGVYPLTTCGLSGELEGKIEELHEQLRTKAIIHIAKQYFTKEQAA